MITNNDLKLIIPFILFVLLGIYGRYLFDYISVSQTLKITFRWCLIPSIAFALYYAYYASFGYKKISVPIWKNFFVFLTMTAVILIISLSSFQGILIIINSKLGNQKDYLLSGKIIKIDYLERKKIGNNYSIEIQRKLENDTIKLNVPTNEYHIGQSFEKEMKIGLLNFIYSEK